MRVLIAYDGSDSANAIFEDLGRAGLPREGRARVVSVADLFVPEDPVPDSKLQAVLSQRAEMILKHAEEHREQVIKETTAAADRAAEKVRAALPDWELASEVLAGNPAWELLDAIDGFAAQLVVVGSQGRSALSRFFLGSVSKRLATDAHCSVRVARSRTSGVEGEGAGPRIIIGVDGSPAAEEAIYAVGRRVWRPGTEVRLVTVDDGTPASRTEMHRPLAAGMITSYLRERDSRVSAMLAWAAEELANVGLMTSVVAQRGDAKGVLLEEARKWPADSIFVGTRDFSSAFERFRLGSVSTAVVTNAVCSVEIVRPND